MILRPHMPCVRLTRLSFIKAPLILSLSPAPSFDQPDIEDNSNADQPPL